MVWLAPTARRQFALAWKLLIGCMFHLEAAMACSIRGATGRWVLSALVSAVLAGCAANSPGPAPDAATASDAHLAQDATRVPDSASDHSIAPDTIPSDIAAPSDVAPGDVPVATDVAQDTVVPADGPGDRIVGPDAVKPDVSATDAASSEASVADVRATDVASSDAIVTPGDAFALGIATASSSIPRVVDPQVPALDSATLASDNAAFAFAAYKQLTATNTNLVFSPASISIALAMTYAGAAGNTASEMAQALHFSLPSARLHPAFNALDQALASRGQGKPGADGGPMRLNIVNATWAERTYTFKTAFLDTLATNYGAGVNLLDFVNAPDPSRLTINAWVADQTENKIQDLLPPGSINNVTRLVLTNAVYFNAAWKTQFDPNMSYDGRFALIDGSSVAARIMLADPYGGALAMQGTNFVAVSLPYADDRLSLVLVVPDAGTFSQFESSLDASTLTTIVAGLTSQMVSIFLPRFKVETGADLASVFKALGMTSAFSPGVADFSGMDGTRDLYISGVVHKAFIDVAEKGTEAAAATGVAVRTTGISPGLRVDATRPFLYFLRDQPTGAILFMGRVLDPSKN
jgi:serpin B